MPVTTREDDMWVVRSCSATYEILPPTGMGPPWWCAIRTLPDGVFVAQVQGWDSREEAMNAAQRLAKRLALADDAEAWARDMCRHHCTGREHYAPHLRHAPNCPAVDLGIAQDMPGKEKR